jgi:hypothetical protein
MKSHGFVGLALALVVLVFVSAMPLQAVAGGQEQSSVEFQTLVPGSDSGAKGGTGDEPGTGTLNNGDPEDWLGGQNVKPGPSQSGDPAPTPPGGLLNQVQSWWQMLLFQAMEKLTR